MPPNVAIVKLRHCVALVMLGGSRRNSDDLGHSVAIVTSSSKRRNCNTLSKCRYCDTFLGIATVSQDQWPKVNPITYLFPAPFLLIVAIHSLNPDPTALIHFRAHKVIV